MKSSALPSYGELNRALRSSDSNLRSKLTTAFNNLSRFRVWIAKKMYQSLPRPLKNIVKKIGRIEARIHKKILCWKPRLQRRYGRLVYPNGLTVKSIIDKKQNFFEFVKTGDAEDEHVEYIEDCFEDMERPKFGWRVKVTLLEEEPCELNVENPELSTCKLSSNPDNNILSGGSDFENNYYKYYAQSRQTGEGFRSSAAIDCRYRYICGDTNQTPENQGPTIPIPPVQSSPRPAAPVPPVEVTQRPIIPIPPVQVTARPSVPFPPSPVPDAGNPFRPLVTDEEVPVQVLGPQDFYGSPDAQDVYGSPDARQDVYGLPQWLKTRGLI